jgi:hypothetical protein
MLQYTFTTYANHQQQTPSCYGCHYAEGDLFLLDFLQYSYEAHRKHTKHDFKIQFVVSESGTEYQLVFQTPPNTTNNK